MLYESQHLRVSADDGIATLWLAFPGSPVNALSPARVTEIGRALDSVLDSPHLDAVVIRSGLPAGFCGGYLPGIVDGLISDDDAAEFARAGQRVFARLAASDVVSVAYIEGPCVGPGLELALACDYRLAVAGPDSAFGFPDAVPPCWGGPTRLERLKVRGRKYLHNGGPLSLLSAREAGHAGLIDHAFSQRRGKIELRTWLDALQAKPRKPGRGLTRPVDDIGFPAETLAYRHAIRNTPPRERSMFSPLVCPTTLPLLPLPRLIGVDVRGATVGDHVLMDFAVEAALRGGNAVVVGSADRLSHLENHIHNLCSTAVVRGRATPLESGLARGRLSVAADASAAAEAGLIVVDNPSGRRLTDLNLRPSAILAVLRGDIPDRPQAAGISLPARCLAYVTPGPSTSRDTVNNLSNWLPRLGFQTVIRPNAIETTHRVAA